MRPLLEVERSELEGYLRALDQPWCEDATNRDLQHTRNRVRHLLLPLLEREFNPAVREVLADTADLARAEQEYWEDAVNRVSPGCVHMTAAGPGRFYGAVAPSTATSEEPDEQPRPGEPEFHDLHLAIEGLQAFSPALQRQLLYRHMRQWTPVFGFSHVEKVRSLVAAPNGTEVQLPWRFVARRWPTCPTRSERAHGGPEIVIGYCEPSSVDYEYALPIPGAVLVAELGMVLRAKVVTLSGAGEPGYNRKTLLDPQRVGPELRVRNWRAGDRFWPAHSKSPSKVKELLQRRHICGRERAFWPVAVKEGQLVWMRGFSVPREFAAPGAQGVLIEEDPFPVVDP